MRRANRFEMDRGFSFLFRVMRVSPFALILFTPLLGAGGCVHYEFDLTQPPNLARHIGGGRETIAALDPLEYHFQAYESRLVVRIFNPTDDPIRLLGERSFVVDPAGQSHPLRNETIAPHSFIKRILPPMPPTFYRSGPSFGVGIGLSSGGWRHRRGFYEGEYFDDGPRYYSLYDENDGSYWNWPADAEARVSLTFQRAERTFHDEFVFRKKKA